MKRFLYCFLLFAACVFASCSKDDGLPAPVISGSSVSWDSDLGSDVVVGSVVTYTVKCENVEIVRYEWSVNGTVDSEADGPTFVLTPAQRGDYSVKVVLYNADGGSTAQEFMTLTVKDPAPVVTVLCGEMQLEDGGSLDVEVAEGTMPIVLNAGSVEISEYKWTLNGEALENQTKEYTLDLTHSGTNVFEVEVINRDQLSTTVSFTVQVNGPFKSGLWFYGTTYEGIAFFDPAKNLFYQDHLYQELNGETIGDGGLNDLSICNGKIYLLTPSSASSRAQIVECDAQTLKKERVITAEGFNTSSLGEIYNLLAVSADKFYVGNNNSGANNVSGVNVLTVQPDGQNTFVPLSGASGSIGVDGPCWSRMLKVGKNVYIGCGNKLKVFDSETDKELTSIMIAEDRQIADVVRGRDGNVYALVAGAMAKTGYWLWGMEPFTSAASVLAIDPQTFVYTETPILIDGKQTDINAGLEGSGTCASLTSDELFFKGGGGYSTTKVYKYNYKTGTTSLFVDITGKGLNSMVSKYMAADSEGRLYVPTTNYSTISIGVFDIESGAQLGDIQNAIGTVKGDGGVYSTYTFGE